MPEGRKAGPWTSCPQLFVAGETLPVVVHAFPPALSFSCRWTVAHIFIPCQIRVPPCWRLQVGVQAGLGPREADLGALPPAGET